MTKTYKGFQGLLDDKATLNSKLFNTTTETLNGTIRSLLWDRSRDFVQKIGLDPSHISDVRLTGGNSSYTYTDESDLDVTLMIDNKKRDWTKEEVRALGISASSQNYLLSPETNGIPTNFYISSRNIGSPRPAGAAVYSLKDNEFLIGPSKQSEKHPNYLTSKATYYADLIENCIADTSDQANDCASKLLKKLKDYRIRGLKTKGEFSTPSLVWRLLSRSGYIDTLKRKVNEIEQKHFKINSPADILTSEDYKMLIRQDSESDIPPCIVKWNSLLLKKVDPTSMLRRVKPILALFVIEEQQDS